MFKDREPFNIHEDFEFRIVCDTLHARMIELEEINNDVVQHVEVDHIIVLWLANSHFKKHDDGEYNIVTIHDKTHQEGYYHQTNSNQQPVHIILPDEPGTHGACHNIRKYLSQDKLSGMLKEICNITDIDCTNRRIANHSL
ncbi:unnamed protein product [Rhizophagus irregularis]|nr:unnamed protein product [Rhizophagus irregularis]